MFGAKAWTPDEDRILTERYQLGVDHLVGILPNRSRSAIQQRAFKLGVQVERRPRWTEKEDRQVANLYGSLPNKDLAKALGRTASSVKRRAAKLCVTKPKKGRVQ
jgi:hypothetical protein